MNDAVFALSLKNRREQFGLTQKQVADALGIDRSTYSYYETGKSFPPRDTLVRIALMFDISVDAMLGLGTGAAFHEGTPAYHKSKSSAAMVASLSADEKSMIIKFRQLPESLKKKVLDCVDEYLEQTNP